MFMDAHYVTVGPPFLELWDPVPCTTRQSVPTQCPIEYIDDGASYLSGSPTQNPEPRAPQSFPPRSPVVTSQAN